jgi:hypothetical protein
MTSNIDVDKFLSEYSDEVFDNAQKIRKIILKNLPKVQEQIDIPARMIAYTYGQKYNEMVCTLIPSKKGLKLGFYKGIDLPDPENILEGNGKISRYVEIKKRADLQKKPLIVLLKEAFKAYKIRNNK